MLRYVLSGVFLLIVSMACQNDCEENAPQPLSFNIQWVDAKGEDIYNSKEYSVDSLVAFYKGARTKVAVKLNFSTQKNGNSTIPNVIDMMPLVREAFYLQLDTVFVGPKSSDIDTVVLKVVREENDCFTTLYRFEKLEYNGTILNGTEALYKIEK